MQNILQYQILAFLQCSPLPLPPPPKKDTQKHKSWTLLKDTFQTTIPPLNRHLVEV